MKVSKDELREEFLGFGISLDDDELLQRMQTFCIDYDLDVSSVVSEWLAFSHSSKLSSTVNSDYFNKFEKKLNSSHRNSLPITSNKCHEELNGNALTTDKKRNIPLEVGTSKQLNNVKSPTVVAPYSPSILSSQSSPALKSAKYSSRANKGSVVNSFGVLSAVNWKVEPVKIDVFDPEGALCHDVRFMFQKVYEKIQVLNNMIEDMGAFLKKRLQIEEFLHPGLPVQESIQIVGRIVCDGLGKLNSQSVLLESGRDFQGHSVSLDISNIDNFSLFPGQIVALSGVNPTGDNFLVEKVFESQVLPFSDKIVELKYGLHIVIACGPFITNDAILTDELPEPLNDILDYTVTNKPNVLILIGPFLDNKNNLLQQMTHCSFADGFSNMVHLMTEKLNNSVTKVVMIPSQKDLHHLSVYPQHPFKMDKIPPWLYFMPDPVMLSVNDVIIGITSTDILFHLGAEEICRGASLSDRIGRLVHHILTQHNFYPLYPPSSDVNIDYTRYETNAQIVVRPHVLITPSDFKHFVKDVAGTCCINPGHLVKGATGGTFATLFVQPTVSKDDSLIKDIGVQILKI